jgi:hypothetical protein
MLGSQTTPAVRYSVRPHGALLAKLDRQGIETNVKALAMDA